MWHLSTERLAALADDAPTTEEAQHLAACAVCAGEREAHERVVLLAAGDRDRLAPPLTNWTALSAQLRTEGLMAEPRSRFGGVRRWGWQAAAAVALLAVGAAAGRFSATAPGGARAIASVDTSLVASTATAVTPVSNQKAFESTAEAMAVLAAAQADYQRAATYLLAHDSTARDENAPQIYRARLAALDGMAAVSRAALREAPQDPVINQYYLSTSGAREVTLRQLGASLPAGTRLASY